MRERELKPSDQSAGLELSLVAPHAGARIETFFRTEQPTLNSVAPHAGARIETLYSQQAIKATYVAPHAGARIET